jgi:Tol biopolymer transport system component
VNLYALRINEDTGIASGAPVQLTNWFEMVPWYPSITRDGSRLALTKARDWFEIYIADLQDGGNRLGLPRSLGPGRSIDLPSAWTKNGNWIYFDSDRNGPRQIFRLPLDGRQPEIVQGNGKYLSNATLSPDEKWILFVSSDPDLGTSYKPKLMRMPAGGGGAEFVARLADSSPSSAMDCAAKVSSVSCTLSAGESSQLAFYALDPEHGQGRELDRTDIRAADYLNWKISRDGSRIAISSTDRLPGKIRVIDLIRKQEHDIALPEGIAVSELTWTADDKALLALATEAHQGVIVKIELNGKFSTLTNLATHELSGIIPSPDGHHLAFSQRTLENNVWLVANS